MENLPNGQLAESLVARSENYFVNKFILAHKGTVFISLEVKLVLIFLTNTSTSHLNCFFIYKYLTVLVLESQNIPEVVVVRRGAGGVLGSWKGDGSTG